MPDDLEQLVPLLGGEHRGGLVQDEDLGIPVQGFEDLHPLQHSYREGLDHRSRVDRQPVSLGEFRHLPDASGPVDQAAAHGFFPEDHVVGHSERREQPESLVHHAQSRSYGLECRREPYRFPVHQDLSGIGREQTEQYRHQGGLARSVLADHRVDFTGPDRHVDGVVRQDPWEPFGDTSQLERRRHRIPANCGMPVSRTRGPVPRWSRR